MEIHGVRYNSSSGNETVVSAGTARCFVLSYTITVLQDDKDQGLPERANLTLYILPDAKDRANAAGGMWAKWVYSDSDGNYGVWEDPAAADPSTALYIYSNGTSDYPYHDQFTSVYFVTLWTGFLVDYDEGFRDGKYWQLTILGNRYRYETNAGEREISGLRLKTWEARTTVSTAEGDQWTNSAVISGSINGEYHIKRSRNG